MSMPNFILELRRREVFRTLGLYVGVCWIVIEAVNVLLPAFDGPEWVLRVLIVAAMVGFPIAGVLAWIYNLTTRGIERDADGAQPVAPPLGRKMDFIVIGVLVVALILSVYLNVTSGPAVVEELEPVSVLIADFDNRTGESIFDDLLEQALNIGIESAPHIRSYDRHAAAELAAQLQVQAEGMTADAARLVAVREGLGLVLSGSVATADRGFRFEIVGLEPVSGEPEFDFSALAANRESVLTAIGALSRSVREALGDRTVKRGETAIAETFTAASIEAAGTYMEAIELAYNGRHQEAIEKFRRATELDPNFGRAFSGWAVSEFKLGREADAEALWDRALSLMGTMTERERLRTLGVYYATVTRNYAKAVESFAELVEKYPADAAGRNNLAVSAFYALDFETAATESRRLLEMFPGSRLYRTNSALYAMYSSDFDAAAAQARVIIEDDPEYGSAYLPLAISLLATGDANGARDAYRRMMASATTSEHGESHAMLGLADLSIYVGDLEQARATLQDGIALDRERDAPTAAAIKYVALAATFLEETDRPMALAATRDALALSSQDSVKIAAALVFLEAGETQAAAATADELAPQLQTHNRAYGQMLRAAILRRAGDHVAAIDLLGSALQLADLWRIRYELGRAYLEAGFFAEAFDEFENCYERRGEATAMFLDDTPTVRYLADLPYWTGRAQEGLGMATAAERSYEAFVALQRSGPLAEDARKRLR